MLAPNHELTREIIRSLEANRCPGTYVYDEFSDYDDLSSLLDEELRSNLIHTVEDFNIDKVVFLATDLVDSLFEKDLLLGRSLISMTGMPSVCGESPQGA